MKIHCIVVDDEAPARDELCFLLSKYDDLVVVGEADTAKKAVQIIKKLEPQVVFLDIQMPRQDGFTVVESLQGYDDIPLFVFVTAFDNYAVKAFEANAIDYLLKPVSEKRLDLTMERIRKTLNVQGNSPNHMQTNIETILNNIIPMMRQKEGRPKVVVEKNGRMHLLSSDEIVFCRYENGHIMVHTQDETLALHSISTMDKLEQHLSGLPFFRAHRSILVNLDQIKEFSPWFNGKYCLVMKDVKGTELTVSKARVAEFKRRIGI